jgi:hypothetical protein
VALGAEDDELIAGLCDEFPRAILVPEDRLRGRWKAAVEECQEEDPLLSALRVPIRRDIFLARVWNALL